MMIHVFARMYAVIKPIIMTVLGLGENHAAHHLSLLSLVKFEDKYEIWSYAKNVMLGKRGDEIYKLCEQSEYEIFIKLCVQK